MSTPVIQTSFNAGEWAPALNARVDLQKYHAGAALLLNFFVDYRGGATTRPGTKYVLQCFRPSTQVRLIPFQASFTVSYVLEFGNQYIRFFSNGAPVLESAKTITGATQANPGVITSNAHGYGNGDWIYITLVGGMTQLNGNYYIVTGVTANTFTLTDLQGNVINTTGYGAYTSGGQAQRIYTLASPYNSTDLSQLKYSQNVNQLVLCQPNYAPYVLTLLTYNSWTIAAITFGATISAPSAGLGASSTLAAGTVNYAYVVTSVDINGQESGSSNYITLANLQDIRSVAGSNIVVWTAVTGAVSYNVYRAEPRYGSAVPAGAQFGFVGNLQGTSFTDSNIVPDFSQGPPIVLNPFSGTGVASITLTGNGTDYHAVPTVTLTAPPPGGIQATAFAYLSCYAVNIVNPGAGYHVGDTLNGPSGVILTVTSTAGGQVTGVTIVTQSLITSGNTPTNPAATGSSGGGSGATFNFLWDVSVLGLSNPGTGYLVAPSVTFTGGTPATTATATTTLGAPSAGNPTVPGFFDQRLVLAGPVGNPQQFNMSQPGSYFNFNVNNPIEADDAIQASLVSGRLNSIKSMVTMPAGLIMFSDQQAWLINGGSPGSPISALSIAANSQAYNGSSDLPPIVANANVLYVQAKSSIVRDLAYNFYTNVYAGTNISTLSSHLFYGFTLSEWCWSEEPYKLVWAVRNDGDLLSCTYQKEQEMIAWTHHTTQGVFKSIASITEILTTGPVDAVYHVVQRVVNGVSTQYIERFVELLYPQGYQSSWFVDAGIQYSGSPATNFSGAQHLGGQTVTGVADGVVIPAFTMPANGTFTLSTPASLVTVGIPITAQLQTLALDLGEPTVQGKRKKVSALTVRAQNTLGIQSGRTFSTLVAMKDFVIGNVSTMSNTVITDLVTADGRTIMDPQWDTAGQLCIQQSQPYPATILGIIPEIEVGDDA